MKTMRSRWTRPCLLLALSVALVAAGCGDDGGGGGGGSSNSGTTSTNSGTTSTNSGSTGTTSTNGGTTSTNSGTTSTNSGSTGTTGTNNDPVQACLATCNTLGTECADAFAEVCPPAEVARVPEACSAACDSEDGRAQIAAAANLTCDVVVPLAIGGFGLECGAPGLCEEYCGLVGDNCTGDNAIFSDVGTCLETCAGFPDDGQDGDVAGDTVQCRIYHAGVAAGDPALHCPHASPDGGGVCVDVLDLCDAYCDLVGDNCTGANELYADRDTCLSTCEGFADDGQDGDTAGDTVQCRIYHAGVAADAPEVHCPHASEDGGGVCIDPAGDLCDEYCDLVGDNCTGANAVYADRDACLTACGDFADDGQDGDTAGDTVQCRIYHAGVAAGAPEVHCPHASEGGGGVCIDAGNPDGPGEGDLVISEIMKNPSAVADADGEWFEVWNVSGAELDLDGLTVQDASGAESFTVEGSLLVPAGAYVVFGNNGDSGSNGDVNVDVVYGDALNLANGDGGDSIYLYNGATLVDAVTFDNAAWPNVAGASMQFDGGLTGADDNGDGANWCPARAPYGDGDRGTPGQPNEPCAVQGDVVTIYAIRDLANPDHPDVGAAVRVEDVIVTAVDPDGEYFWAQERDGGPWSGIYVAAGQADLGGLGRGAAVNLEGFYAESFPSPNGTQAQIELTALEVVPGAPVQLAPELLTTQGLRDNAERWEGTLVRVEGVEVTNANADAPQDFGEFVIDDAIRVNDLLHAIDPTPALGNTFEFITGVVNFSFGNYKIEPRDGADYAYAGVADLCAEYCGLMTANCTGPNAQYADMAACMDACAIIPANGAANATDGNSVQCRIYHAGVAADNAALHCPHAGPTGAGFCGDDCDYYCNLTQGYCQGDNAIFADRGECLAACDGYPVSGNPDEVSGNSLECRTYHAGVAVIDPALHCPHASPNGGGVCVSDARPPAPGDLVISEIMKDPSAVNDALGEWFEIWNVSGDPISLEGVVFQDNDGGESFTVAGAPDVMPGQYYVLGTNGNLANNGGVEVDYAYSDTMILGNTSDTLVIVWNGQEIDRVDYSDAAGWPDVAGQSMIFSGGLTGADDNNDPANWCGEFAAYGDGDMGSPGRRNRDCDAQPEEKSIRALTDENDPDHPMPGSPVLINGAVVTAVDAGRGFVWVQDAAGGPWSGLFVDVDALDLSGVERGDTLDLSGVYTETFVGPEGSLATLLADSITDLGAGPVPEPELLEVAVLLDNPEPWESVLVAVLDVTVTDANPDAPGDDFGEFEVAGGLRVDDLLYAIDPDPALEDGFSFLAGVLNYNFGNHKIIPRDADDVERGVIVTPCGAYCDLMEANCAAPNAVFADRGECLSACANYPVSGNPDAVSGDSVECRTYHAGVAAGDAALHCPHASPNGGGVCVAPSAGASPDEEGDLVITEIMQNPDLVGDTDGEWFEVWNASGEVLDLNGVMFTGNNDAGYTVDQPFLVEPGAYVVLGRNGNMATNGGVPVDLEYGTAISLGNSSDALSIMFGNTTIDTVAWDNGATFPDPVGASMQFDGDLTSADDNADGSNWCEARTPYGDGDFGTPGEPNEGCSIPVEPKSIQEVRNPAEPGHPAVGTGVEVEGIITAIDGGDVWIQANGGGPWSGIYVDAAGIDLSGLDRGDVIRVGGIYEEINGDALSSIDAFGVALIDSAPVPAAEPLDVFTLANPFDAEQWESVLVEVNNLTVTDANPDVPQDFGEFVVDFVLRVDDQLYAVDPDPAVDDRFAGLTGVVTYSFGNYKLLPRDADDVEASVGGGTVDVEIRGFAFDPPQVTITVGTTVRWTQFDSAPHDVRSTDAQNNIVAGPLNSPLLSPGQTYEYTFTEPGVFSYRCAPHAFMQGTVFVDP